VIDGDKALVPHADRADELIVATRTEGSSRDREGITLLRVRSDLPGVDRRAVQLQDGRGAADVRFKDVRVSVHCVVGEVDRGLELLEAARDAGIAAVAAEAVGVMERLLELTQVHLGERKQFGQPIGAFQALQHRAADMLVELEQARSMALYAALVLSERDVPTRRRALSQVKTVIGAAGRAIAQGAVQLHGGLGVSDEHWVGHGLKRLMAIEQSFGDRDHHLRALASTQQ
jgi:alkylation response protein AidB-like acyl-CoA dehydrogenase